MDSNGLRLRKIQRMAHEIMDEVNLLKRGKTFRSIKLGNR